MGLPFRLLSAIFVCVVMLSTWGSQGVLGFFSRAPGSSAKCCYLHKAGLATETLQSWYEPTTGLWRTTGWWNAANALTTLVNYSKLSRSTKYRSAVENTFSVNAPSGFLNKYYDDEGWWALAWIDAYDWTGNRQYLKMASSIFEDMKGGWDDVCGGGTWWSKDRTYKNAIANELFLSVAAHLANRVNDADEKSELIEWAKREWEWFSQSGMINADHAINDGLSGNCKNNGGRVWTYNQGVVLGGLTEFSRLSPDPSLPATAQAIAFAAIEKLTDSDGVLHDPCEPGCGADGPQFKGIFARNLMALNDAFPDPCYATFAEINARSIWNNARGPNNQLGLVWSVPFNGATAATQSSALDALIAAARMMQRFARREREDDGANSPLHKRKADDVTR